MGFCLAMRQWGWESVAGIKCRQQMWMHVGGWAGAKNTALESGMLASCPHSAIQELGDLGQVV